MDEKTACVQLEASKTAGRRLKPDCGLEISHLYNQGRICADAKNVSIDGQHSCSEGVLLSKKQKVSLLLRTASSRISSWRSVLEYPIYCLLHTSLCIKNFGLKGTQACFFLCYKRRSLR
jgi:hypothetical protein